MFPRAQRLRRSAEIMTVFRRGQRKSAGPLSCHFIPGAEAQVAVIVDKKVSKLATERNTIKRRIRAALRELSLPAGQLIVRAHSGSLELSYIQIRANLKTCLSASSRSS